MATIDKDKYSEKFYRNRYFVAENPRDFSMDARCNTCGAAFGDHYNGHCPVEDDSTTETTEGR